MFQGTIESDGLPAIGRQVCLRLLSKLSVDWLSLDSVRPCGLLLFNWHTWLASFCECSYLMYDLFYSIFTCPGLCFDIFIHLEFVRFLCFLTFSRKHRLPTVVYEAGVQGCEHTPKKFDLVKIREKSAEIWAKSMKTFEIFAKSLKLLI